ncbi:asparagine synthetase domain-containing protein 1-like [Neltuma alba]|uniref:asparagine synthetase domain-containing protein 1-like n=1 Tax=Neltuma alba TaxID=207710 RepID=UPI0010A30A03|nr:asparagine synthetase domain-containing protein 1-like [Prosopis alba]
MCGIALIVSGVRIDVSCLFLDSTCPPHKTEDLVFSVDDLKAALRRRGPDSLGSKKVNLQFNISGQKNISTFIEDDEALELGADIEKLHIVLSGNKCDCVSLDNGLSCSLYNAGVRSPSAELHFIGATLQLRGINPLVQPLVDSHENILVYNGEIFGGIHIASDYNDAEFLMQALAKCGSRDSIPDLLSMIKGPWAIIYWQDSSRTLWFGRDAFGRRSLLVHWPTEDDPTFMLSSVSPLSPIENKINHEASNGTGYLSYWEELPCGIYSVHVEASNSNRGLIGEVRRHEYTNSTLKELIKWERTSIEPKPEDLRTSQYESSRMQHNVHSTLLEAAACETGPNQFSLPAHSLLKTLKESVFRRTSLYTIYQATISDVGQEGYVPVAVLFSGGLDSMILAALLDQCLDPCYEIDLLNVSFDGQSAPDRLSGKAGLEELRRVAPSRRWRLVEVDAELSDLAFETSHVMSLIEPANTYMDLNIGIALWLAARGDGWVSDGNSDGNDNNLARIKYKSKARILLVGSGADEQCAGYGRHRTSYRRGSWLELDKEMKLDIQRIWKRNLGRDDRCIADNGKEARFPFLDEDVMRILLNFPLWEVTNLDQPSGIGDKKILRKVAQLLGLHEAAVLPKRAIQFGSRIARESNRKNFGSNRAANQASAGSVMIHSKSNLS